MQSFIIAHALKEKRDEYIVSYLEKQNVSTFDRIHILGETSLGIEEIRVMQKSVFLTPVKGEKKAIILEEAQTLTTEAQNALLKILEEPPVHVIFFLSTTTADSLLPTILSRCTHVLLAEVNKKLTEEELQELNPELALLLSDSIAKRLFLAEKIAAKKEEVPVWLRVATQTLRERLLEDVNNNKHLAPVLAHLQEAYRVVTTTNTNARMVLEHTFLLLPNSS